MKRRRQGKTIRISAVFAVCLIIVSPAGRAEIRAASSPAAEPAERRHSSGAIASGESLSMDRCVQIALRNSPSILAASYSVNVSRSRVGQAWSAYYPQLAVNGAYAKRDMTNTIVPFGHESYSASATLTQNIVDFGRTGAQVAVRLKDLDAAKEELRDATASIVFNVKSAYYGLLRAEKNRDVLRETVLLFEKQLEQAQGFYEAGVRSRFDVTSAEVELSNQRLNLIKAENALRIARITLNNAMGTPAAPEYILDDALTFRKYTVSLDEARDRAFLNRPDLIVAAARREGAETSLALTRKGHYPTLSGNASYSRVGESYPPERDFWNIGLTLTIPMFNGFLTSHQVKEAMESLNAVKANEEALRQNVLLTVQQVYFKLLEAEELVGVSELAVKKAEENYDIAVGRYQNGMGSPLDVTNALVTLSNARTNVISALVDYKVAEAELRRAMGE